MIGLVNKVATGDARQAIDELCAEHDVPLDAIIPSTSDIVAADRRGEPLDRAKELQDRTRVDSLWFEAAAVFSQNRLVGKSCVARVPCPM